MAVDQEIALSLEEPLLNAEQAAALLNVRPSGSATRRGLAGCRASASVVTCGSRGRCSSAGRRSTVSRTPWHAPARA